MSIGVDYNRYPWSTQSIDLNAPSASGVYAIFNGQSWIYVGESGDIHARLLQHINGDNTCITRCAPVGFQFELVPAAQRVARQNQLILQLVPICNRRLG